MVAMIMDQGESEGQKQGFKEQISILPKTIKKNVFFIGSEQHRFFGC